MNGGRQQYQDNMMAANPIGGPRTQNNYYQRSSSGYPQQFPGYLPPSIGQVHS